jgi:hypothetical protein
MIIPKSCLSQLLTSKNTALRAFCLRAVRSEDWWTGRTILEIAGSKAGSPRNCAEECEGDGTWMKTPDIELDEEVSAEDQDN